MRIWVNTYELSRPCQSTGRRIAREFCLEWTGCWQVWYHGEVWAVHVPCVLSEHEKLILANYALARKDSLREFMDAFRVYVVANRWIHTLSTSKYASCNVFQESGSGGCEERKCNKRLGIFWDLHCHLCTPIWRCVLRSNCVKHPDLQWQVAHFFRDGGAWLLWESHLYSIHRQWCCYHSKVISGE